MKRFLVAFLVLYFLCAIGFSQDPGEIYQKPWEQMTHEERHDFMERRTKQLYEPSGKPSPDRIFYYIQIFKETNVFDPKVTVFDVKAEDRGGTITLTGEVMFEACKNGLERTLKTLGFDKIDMKNVLVLPDPQLGAYQYAVVTSPDASIKRSPREKSEQINQVVNGDPLRLLKRDESGDYYLVQGPDAYVGWVDAKNIKKMTLKQWTKERRIAKDDKPMKNRILEITKPIMGIPYVWGGTTSAGMDCSGLTQFIYKNLGVNLPRDADEQSNIGELVAFAGYRDNLRAGDLLFFSRSGRVSHVAISLGETDFLQSIGAKGVHISSMDPDSPLYHKETEEKFIFAKRILKE